MDQDTVDIPPHSNANQRTTPAWALVCLWAGVWFLVCAIAYFATINVGRIR